MQKNISKADRIVRLLLGLALISWALLGKLWVPGVVGLVLVLTAAIGWCGLYQLMGKKAVCPVVSNKDEKKDGTPSSKGCCCRK